MTISVVTFNERNVNDGTIYETFLVADSFERRATPTQIQPPGAWPRHIRANQQPRTLQVAVAIRSGVLTTRQRELAQWFANGTEGLLVIDEDGVRKQLSAVVVGSQAHPQGSALFYATLVAADPRWRSVAAISSAGDLTASGQTWIVNNPGNAAVDDAVITIRPTVNKAAASGYLYMIESVIAWRAERPSGYYAVEITEGWDHATEVGAGRSQADADDVRVLVDGIEVPRWIGENAATDANSATTNIWVNLNYSPRKTATLLNAITVASPSADGDLLVSKGGTLGWPREGALLVDDEVILYTGRTESNADGNAAFTGVTRGARGTTIATHSAAATCYWVEHRVQIVYGNTGVSAPDSRADLKPLLDLTSSTISNVRHEWINFADETYPGRSMQWGRRNRTNDDQYTKILAPTGSPAANMTLEYQSGGAVSGKPNYNTWYRDLPTGSGSSGGNISTITRAVADTLGMWSYGFDNDGREIVLEKYSGALSSGSDTTTAPTNPVYRYEFWGFNQVIAKRPDLGSLTGTSQSMTATATDNAQQFLVGAQPVEVTGGICYLGGAADIIMAIRPDNGSTSPGASDLRTSGVFSTGADQYQAFTFTATALQPDTRYWLCASLSSGTPTWFYIAQKYAGGASRRAAAAKTDEGWNFALLGRPTSLATSFTRCDETSYADNGDQITIDGVTIHLATAGVPYVALKSRQGIYRFVSGVLHNETTGQSATVMATCGMSNELQIAIGQGTAINLEDGTPILVEYSEPDARFTLAPGENSLRFVEAGLAGVQVLVEGYGAWE